jgi:hypothetical protein
MKKALVGSYRSLPPVGPTPLLSCVYILELFVCGYRDAVFSLVLVLFVSEFLGLIFVERLFD